jgi:hypothetical protein
MRLNLEPLNGATPVPATAGTGDVNGPTRVWDRLATATVITPPTWTQAAL